MFPFSHIDFIAKVQVGVILFSQLALINFVEQLAAALYVAGYDLRHTSHVSL